MKHLEKPSKQPSPEESGVRSTNGLDRRRRQEEDQEAYLKELERKIENAERHGDTVVSASPKQGRSDREYLRELEEKIKYMDPENPWEPSARHEETDTAKVWGVNPDDAEAADKAEDEAYKKQKEEIEKEFSVDDVLVGSSRKRKRKAS